MCINTDVQDTSRKATCTGSCRVICEGEAVGGKEARWQACCHSPAVNYCQFMQLDAAENNGGIELGAVDKAHGSFIRRSTLLFVAGGARPTK